MFARMTQNWITHVVPKSEVCPFVTMLWLIVENQKSMAMKWSLMAQS